MQKSLTLLHIYKKPRLSAAFYMAVREGLTKTRHVFCPRGSLRSVQTAPGGLSNPARALTLPHLYKQSLVSARLFYMAVREGFEPSNGCPLHAFQACAFSHSATSPYNCKQLSKRPFCEARILHKSHAKRNGKSRIAASSGSGPINRG